MYFILNLGVREQPPKLNLSYFRGSKISEQDGDENHLFFL